MKKLFITTLFFCLILPGFFGVSAQETATSEATSWVFIQERETEKITQLRLLYRDQVLVYRNSENEYSIAKTNYEQVLTLSALEEAVAATEKVMFDRSRVMITYLELISAVLSETKGVELDLKSQSQTEMSGLINLLRGHQEKILVSKDRLAMATLSDEFAPIAVQYENAVYKALSLIRIGNIQEVRDKAKIIKDDIVLEHSSQEVSAFQLAGRERAYAEIERNFKTINDGLIDLNLKFLDISRDGYSRTFYQRVLSDLGPIFAELTRSLDHLEELIRL